MKSRTTVMVSIVLAMLVASIDTTIMNTTMPIIAEELGRFDLYAWSFASYMIFCTVLSPVAGRISDIFGRKHVFGFGILFFLAGSLLCGISESMVQLVIFRAVQGIGAGIMMPFPMIIAGDLFPVEKRGKIQALFTGMWGLSAILAPLLGAFFVEYMSWRWIFYVNLPVCLLAFVTLLPYKEVYTPKKTSIDYIGAVLFAIGVTLILLVTVLEQYQLLVAALGAAVMVIFYYYEKKQTSPIVPLSLIQDPTIRWINVNGFAACAALFGIGSFIPLFLQDVAGQSLFMSGLALLGMAVGWMVVSVPAGKWVLKYGYRRLLVIGNILLVLSGITFFLINEDTGFWYVLGAMTVMGLAFGLTSTVSMISAQQLVEPHQKGIATSFLMFCRNIGTAVGVTVMGALLYGQSDVLDGFHYLFLFGLIGSIVAFLSSLWIRNRKLEVKASLSYKFDE
ncbi:MDR family MFS transporter [Paenibacillus harenae]|uniref:MDR family MFS transporter n=1 Tax=Paenibacillus harenae TaxID=306543 RepID=UPI0004108B21|nr:MDR family MFS transporter [Paenibacillus harenae]